MVTDAFPAGGAMAGALPSVRDSSHDGPHRCPSTCSSAGLATRRSFRGHGLNDQSPETAERQVSASPRWKVS